MYHGTRNGGFYVFDTSKAEEPGLVKTKNAFWFTDSKQMAESFSGENETEFRGKNPMTYKCFLDMRNPLVVDFEGKSWGESIYGSTDEIVRKAQEEGYDGVIIKNVRDGGMYGQFLTKGNEYIVFEPNQIKSATDNIGTFDKANPDIRYSRREKTRAGETDDLEYRFIGEKGAAAIDKAEEATTPAGKKTATQRQAEQMQTYRNTAEQAAKSVGEEVTVVEKVEDIVDDDPKVQLKKRGAKGWYDPGTGKVVVNLSAHRDAADVAETVFHETIGHKGIEKKGAPRCSVAHLCYLLYTYLIYNV